MRAVGSRPPGRKSTSSDRDADDVKVVVVVRGELRLTPGKAAVQVAHAAVELYRQAVERSDRRIVRRWLSTGEKKIALVAPTLSELEALARTAEARGLPTVWIRDAGLTEVAPGTVTCLGIGPAASSELDRVTGHLELL